MVQEDQCISALTPDSVSSAGSVSLDHNRGIRGFDGRHDSCQSSIRLQDCSIRPTSDILLPQGTRPTNSALRQSNANTNGFSPSYSNSGGSDGYYVTEGVITEEKIHPSRHPKITNVHSDPDDGRTGIGEEAFRMPWNPALLRDFFADLLEEDNSFCKESMTSMDLTLTKAQAMQRISSTWKTTKSDMSNVSVNQRTQPVIRQMTYTWELDKFFCLRDHAALSALPHLQNYLESEVFGDPRWGRFFLMLFPFGEGTKDTGNVVVKVVSNNKHALTAKATFCLLNKEGKEIEWTRKAFDGYKWFQTSLYYNSMTLFTEQDLEDLRSKSRNDDKIRLKCVLEVCENVILSMDSPGIPLEDKIICHSLPIQVGQFVEGLFKEGESNLLDLELQLINEPKCSPIYASSLVLAARSPVFLKMFQSPFCEAAGGSRRAVKIDDISYAILKDIIEFMHTDRSSILETKSLKAMFDLLSAANRYQCEALRLHCREKIMNILNVQNVLYAFSCAINGPSEDPFIARYCIHYLSSSGHRQEAFQEALFALMPWVQNMKGMSDRPKSLRTTT